MMNKLSIEEMLILVFLAILVVLGFVVYYYPSQFFAIYDKILFFILR